MRGESFHVQGFAGQDPTTRPIKKDRVFSPLYSLKHFSRHTDMMRKIKPSLHAQYVSQNIQPADGFHPSLHTSHPYANELKKRQHSICQTQINKCTESGRVSSGAEGEGKPRAYLVGRQRWFLDGGLAQGSTQAWIQEAGWSGDGRGGVELSRQRWKKKKRLSFRLCISPYNQCPCTRNDHLWSN